MLSREYVISQTQNMNRGNFLKLPSLDSMCIFAVYPSFKFTYIIKCIAKFVFAREYQTNKRNLRGIPQTTVSSNTIILILLIFKMTMSKYSQPLRTHSPRTHSYPSSQWESSVQTWQKPSTQTWITKIINLAWWQLVLTLMIHNICFEIKPKA